jgi:hypothetical protein
MVYSRVENCGMISAGWCCSEMAAYWGGNWKNKTFTHWIHKHFNNILLCPARKKNLQNNTILYHLRIFTITKLIQLKDLSFYSNFSSHHNDTLFLNFKTEMLKKTNVQGFFGSRSCKPTSWPCSQFDCKRKRIKHVSNMLKTTNLTT